MRNCSRMKLGETETHGFKHRKGMNHKGCVKNNVVMYVSNNNVESILLIFIWFNGEPNPFLEIYN